jgi:hypothetical protein
MAETEFSDQYAQARTRMTRDDDATAVLDALARHKRAIFDLFVAVAEDDARAFSRG